MWKRVKEPMINVFAPWINWWAESTFMEIFDGVFCLCYVVKLLIDIEFMVGLIWRLSTDFGCNVFTSYIWFCQFCCLNIINFPCFVMVALFPSNTTMQMLSQSWLIEISEIWVRPGRTSARRAGGDNCLIGKNTRWVDKMTSPFGSFTFAPSFTQCMLYSSAYTIK